jgi:DNA-binding NtrC family response regulator
MSGRILIIDDEKDMLVLLERILSSAFAYEIVQTYDPLHVPGLLKKNRFDVVVTDLKMPHHNGIQVLEMVKEKDETTAVIIMTAYGSIESAIEATRKGAYDYITKPFRKERILHVVEKAIKWQQLQKENVYLREKLGGKPQFPALLGTSGAMERLHSQIDRVAATSATVLITGESGTGKELVARAIHAHSLRKTGPFIPIDCSTIPETIIESELFGHLKGAFTGAIRDKKGLVEEADRGTLFLDEIGDLSVGMQVKLLRLLQEGEFKPVGGNTIRKVDIRFVTATNRNLSELIKKGEFREDLFYRLNVINIHLPPLRERMDDIPILARHFIEKYCVIHGKKVKTLSQEGLSLLVLRDWPGNIRELENVIERGIIMAPGDILFEEDLLSFDSFTSADPVPPHNGDDIFAMPLKEAKDKLIEEFQARYIAKALARHGGNVSQAARDSGVKRQYLHRLMRETNLDSKTFKKPNSTQ